MAFPTTSLLDDFNRANAATLGANWSTGVESGYSDLNILSNQAYAPTGTEGNVWGTQFAADQEAWVTVNALPASSIARLYARVQNPGTGSLNCYAVEMDPTGGYLVKFVAGGSTFIGSGGFGFSPGDKVGISCIGTSITYYVYSGGSWASQDVVVDSSVSGAGYIGLDSHNSATRFDDFGGGALPGPVVAWTRA